MRGYDGYFKQGDGKIRLYGYDTESDLKRAERDITRAMVSLANMSVYGVIKELEPYRRAAAKDEKWEDE